MGRRNFLVEGVSGSGKTTVCDELLRRGHQGVHGDRVLAYQGDPVTGEPTDTARHENHLWRLDLVEALLRDRTVEATFLCGGSRNVHRFVDRFDGVFVLDVDDAALLSRLERRPAGEFGAEPEDRELVLRLHRTGEDTPRTGVVIDTSVPVTEVVDAILRHAGLPLRVPGRDAGGTP
ncbi:thymidylate kinase [Friedmanniella endophytica]|uniref:Thymidylate kinase n=1 Tax=Microlunatus kandeliicorticis TaxID=1759536 RepID=A0A7W3IRP8_9ACTN|nr:AAA family ATPase [Microlunatus kandeliicorticis]MBA8793945.1 thymidylate kinase [Microlunatus kandeliicorticis]